MIGLLAASLAAPRRAATTSRGAGEANFSRQHVIDAARTLSSRPFEPPAPVPEILTQLGYDDYRDIRYRKSEAIWGDATTAFAMELFAPGFLYTLPVDVFIVENGTAYPLSLTRDSFELPTDDWMAPLLAVGKFAGFRLHYPLNADDYKDEFLVFQGASYFRAVSRGQIYGLSARGLAIDVAEQKGEEHPLFRQFWIERPSAGADAIVVHALLDSPGVAGAYRFGIFPGEATRMDVHASLFPRRDLDHVGLAPLTSMFMHSQVNRGGVDDFRPVVHDSQALVVHTANGERIWRGLANPESLQVSSFADSNPQGFGLIQRDRRFSRFEDLEARYELRPSAWVQPLADWGEGQVQLVEIPSDSEANDNIVAYWRPKARLAAGRQFDYNYRLTWPNDSPPANGLAQVIKSFSGRVSGGPDREFVVDYSGLAEAGKASIEADATVSAGRITSVVVQENTHVNGFRVALKFAPPEDGVAELRLQPRQNGKPCGETWLYRFSGA